MNLGVLGARGIPSTYSGYETFLTVLLPELAARGHHVTMYCRRGEVGGSGDWRNVARVVLPVVRTKQLATLSHGALAAARARLARHQVVFAVNVANAAYALLLKGSRQRVVLNTDGLEWRRGKWGPAARTYFELSAHIAGASVSALVSDCEAMRAVYKDRFGADSTVIPYCWSGIDSHQRPEVLPTLGLVPRRYFLVAGRLNPENNIHRVVKAYMRGGFKLPLVVLGAANYDSPVAHSVRTAAAANSAVRMAGHVADRGAYATLVGEAAAYIHAHSVGGINPSLIEAMGCGARIVALATVFNRQALGDTSTYFEDFDRELPEALMRLEEDPDGDRCWLRARARARATSVFSLDKVASAYEHLFQRVAHTSPWKRTTLPTSWSVPHPGPPIRA